MAQKQQPAGGPSYNDLANFMHAAGTGGTHGVVRFLDKYPTFVDINDADQMTALRYAAQSGDVAVAELLVSRGATVNPPSFAGWTPLMDAVREGREAMAQFLLLRGADVNGSDSYGTTTLMLAAKWGHKTITEMLLEGGAIIDRKDYRDKTALMYACDSGKKDIADMIDGWPEVLRQRAAEKERQRAEAAAKFLKDTSFSGGIEKPMRAPRVLKIRPRGPKP